MIDLEYYKSRINPAYADRLGSESHERQQLCNEIERLRAENEALRSEIGKWVTDYQAQKMRNDRLEWERGNIDEVFRTVSDREIKFRNQVEELSSENEALKEREHTNDILLVEQGDKLAALNDELTELRAFKAACEGQEPIVYCCQGAINAFRHKHASVVGGFASGLIPLYTNPDPEASNLRMQVAKLEAQLEDAGGRGKTFTQYIAQAQELEAQVATLTEQRDLAVEAASERLVGYWDEDDGMFTYPGFYMNETELVKDGRIIPLYRRKESSEVK